MGVTLHRFAFAALLSFFGQARPAFAEDLAAIEAVQGLRRQDAAESVRAGDLYLTMGDWAAFCLDQMKGANGQGKLLKTETYRLIQTPQGKPGMALGWAFQDSMQGHAGPVLVHTGSDGTWFACAARSLVPSPVY